MHYNNIYGQCAKALQTNDAIEFDAGLFLQRILLFDKFTLASIRLKEIPFIADKIGINGLKSLLREDFIQIHCEIFSLTQVGQAAFLKSTQEKGVLPLFSYRFSTIFIADHEDYIEGCLREIKKIPDLSDKDRKEIKRMVRQKLIRVQKNTPAKIFASFQKDLLDQNLVLTSLKNTIKVPDGLTFHLIKLDEEDWKVETNLCSLLKIETLQGHKIVERALLNISGLADTVYKMNDFDSLSGFNSDGDFEIYKEKLRPLGEKMCEQPLNQNFMKLLQVKGLPNFDEILEKDNFSIERLLSIRNTDECKEFRQWLWSLKDAPKIEIRERVDSLKSKSGNFLDSNIGKMIRFGTNTLTGIVAPPLGMALDLVDTFLLDKILKKDGVSAFVNDQYPKLYE